MAVLLVSKSIFWSPLICTFSFFSGQVFKNYMCVYCFWLNCSSLSLGIFLICRVGLIVDHLFFSPYSCFDEERLILSQSSWTERHMNFAINVFCYHPFKGHSYRKVDILLSWPNSQFLLVLSWTALLYWGGIIFYSSVLCSLMNWRGSYQKNLKSPCHLIQKLFHLCTNPPNLHIQNKFPSLLCRISRTSTSFFVSIPVSFTEICYLRTDEERFGRSTFGVQNSRLLWTSTCHIDPGNKLPIT